jgi:hypothetical protein
VSRFGGMGNGGMVEWGTVEWKLDSSGDFDRQFHKCHTVSSCLSNLTFCPDCPFCYLAQWLEDIRFLLQFVLGGTHLSIPIFQ